MVTIMAEIMHAAESEMAASSPSGATDENASNKMAIKTILISCSANSEHEIQKKRF